MIGNFPIKAVEWDQGFTSTQKEQIAVLCEITQGDHAGERYTWYGFFHDADNRKRAFKALRALGWQSDDVVKLDGLGSTEAQGVFKEEPDQSTGQLRTKLAFVNPLIGLALKVPMTPGQKADFAARMRGEILALGAAMPRATPAASSTPQPPRTAASPPAAAAPAVNSANGPPATEWADDEIPF